MKIGPASPHPPVRPAVSQESLTPRGKKDNSSSQPRDWVEISDSARSKLADMADQARREHIEMEGGMTNATTDDATAETTLHDGRLEQIRLKILSGFYDSREVTDRIVDRLSDEMDE